MRAFPTFRCTCFVYDERELFAGEGCCPEDIRMKVEAAIVVPMSFNHFLLGIVSL